MEVPTTTLDPSRFQDPLYTMSEAHVGARAGVETARRRAGLRSPDHHEHKGPASVQAPIHPLCRAHRSHGFGGHTQEWGSDATDSACPRGVKSGGDHREYLSGIATGVHGYIAVPAPDSTFRRPAAPKLAGPGDPSAPSCTALPNPKMFRRQLPRDAGPPPSRHRLRILDQAASKPGDHSLSWNSACSSRRRFTTLPQLNRR